MKRASLTLKTVAITLIGSLVCCVLYERKLEIPDVELVDSEGVLDFLVVSDETNERQLEDLLWAIHLSEPRIRDSGGRLSFVGDGTRLIEQIGRPVKSAFIFRERDRHLANDEAHLKHLRSADSWREYSRAIAASYWARALSWYGAVGHVSAPDHRLIMKGGYRVDDEIEGDRTILERYWPEQAEPLKTP